MSAVEAALASVGTGAALLVGLIQFWVKLPSPVPVLPVVPIPVTWAIVVLFLMRFTAGKIQAALPNKERSEGIRERKGIATLAVNNLTDLWTAPTNEKVHALIRTRENILTAMALHAAYQIRDRYPGHVTANLLLVEGDRLRVVARGRGNDRPIDVTYQQHTMFCAKAIVERRTVSCGNRKAPSKPYRDILAVPLLGEDGSPAIGVVTVDAANSHVFGGREAKITLGLSPYIALLKMTLAAERRTHAG